MYYGKLNKTDIANGPGVRVSLFVSGCRNRCRGCFNPETWNFKYGQPFTDDTLIEISRELENDYISGLSILGGDPMEIENRVPITSLCRVIKSTYPDKTIWLYTGYLYEDLMELDVMKYIDVLVDGPFIEKYKDITLKFRGSKNQRIIDVQKSRETGEVILYEI